MQAKPDRSAELDELNEEMAALIYGISHDLRAPLRTIDGFGQALEEDYGDRLDETGRDYLHRVRSASGRMKELIDDLVALAQVSLGQIQSERVNISEIAHSLLTALARAHPDRAVTWSVQPGVVLRGDPKLLRVALEKLIENSWKFTSKRTDAAIEVGSRLEDGRFLLFVRDNGAGFDPVHAHKLFGPFQRLHTAGEFEGNGIGLAIVRRIIHRHGGKVRAVGAVDEGATIYIELDASLIESEARGQ